MAIIQLTCNVPAAGAGRIDRIVQDLTRRSRAGVRGLFDHDCVRLNGQVCAEAGLLVSPGDVVVVQYDPHVRYREQPRPAGSRLFRRVFEDEAVIVVDKAAAALTVPTDRGETNTVLDVVNRHVARRRGAKAVAVHRLDRGTSGLLVFAKNPRIARELTAQFRVHEAHREYAAIVAGAIRRQSGTFASRLGTSKSLQRFSVRAGRKGELAVTHFRVERRLAGATYVRAWLETGRRNQIRVHFAEAGHPVLGDGRYAPQLAAHANWNAKRLALHAAVLGFEHPITRRPLRFESPLPVEFERFLAAHR